jgi:hypothetical protein
MRTFALRLLLTTAFVLGAHETSAAAPRAWAIDDGEKIGKHATALPFARGDDNPVWSPGQAIRLFALQNETIAIQIVVEAGDAALKEVTVDVMPLYGPGDVAIANERGATDPMLLVGRHIERFVEHFVHVARPSGGKTPRESLGWAAGSGPAPDAWVGWMPDALIPVELAPGWAAYPMRIEPHTNGIVWIDLTVPAGQAPGTYRGEVRIASQSGFGESMPIELEVVGAKLADSPVKTMLYYDVDELSRRIDDPAAEQQLWRLFHRHRITALHDATSPATLQRQYEALDGSLFSRERGYDGPGVGIGDGVLALGAYGALGSPTAGGVAQVRELLGELDARGLLRKVDAFLYVVDEECTSSWAREWRALLDASNDPRLHRLPLAWTCSEDPATQPVDIPILLANYDRARAG